MKTAAPSRPARRRVPALAALVLATVATVVLASLGVTRMMRERPLYDQVGDLEPERSILPQTSITVKYRPCQVARSDSTMAGATCTGGTGVESVKHVEALVADIQRHMDAGVPDEDAARALALVYLYGIDGGGSRPSAAISLLDSALPLTQDSAAVMVDLSAAHLVRASQEQSLLELVEALDWALWAHELKPGFAPALYNRALALDALTADNGAARAWHGYLDAESRPWFLTWLPERRAAWRREAESGMRAATTHRRTDAPGKDATDREILLFAVTNPQRARELGWALLSEWGVATLAGDTAGAERVLRRAELIGTALGMPGRDCSLADQVAYLRKAIATGEGLREVADAHRLYGEFQEAGMDEVRASAKLDSLGAYALSKPHETWVRLGRAATEIKAGRLLEAEHILDLLEPAIDTARYAAAAGQLSMLRGTAKIRLGENGAAEAYLKAEAAFARVGEEPNRGRVRGYLSDAHRISGNPAGADTWLMRAASTMRPFGANSVRHDLLRQASVAALNDSFPRAMRELIGEDVVVTTAGGDSVYLAEARMNRAMLLAASGDRGAAVVELRRAMAIIGVQSPAVRAFFASYEAYVRALVHLDSAPASILSLADSLIANDSRFVWPLRGFALRARALVAIGDTAGARSSLDSVFATLDRSREQGGGAADREVVEGDVGSAVERLVLSLAGAGRNREALEYLTRRDAAFSSVRVPDTRLPVRVPTGRVVVRPLIIGDTLLIWTLAGDSVSLTRSRVSSARLKATIEAVETSLSRGWKADAQLILLYQMLIHPVEARLGTDTELVFVTDGDLAGVPVSALLGPDGKSLVYRYAYWRALSLTAAAASRDTTLPGSAAFLAPTYDPEEGNFEPLPHAGAEVNTASLRYRSRRVLNPALTPSDFIRTLSRYGLVHFAGHAVVDNLHPERSYLALSPGTLGARLPASSIDTLKLQGLRLVVLSACSSLGGSRASSGFTGLSGAFLGAGAHGVVGSLWKVDDRATQALMTAFHEHYRRTGDPVGALQQAQIAMIESDSAVQRRPSTWAAFQFVGR